MFLMKNTYHSRVLEEQKLTHTGISASHESRRTVPVSRRRLDTSSHWLNDSRRKTKTLKMESQKDFQSSLRDKVLDRSRDE